MKVEIDNMLTIDLPNQQVNEYIAKKLTLENPTFIKNQRLGYSTYGMSKKLYLWEQVGINKYRVPFGCLDAIMKFKEEDDQIYSIIPKPTPLNYKCNIPLYEYQQKAVDFMKNEYLGILQAPAGSGKTQIGIALIGAIKQKALWVTHTQDLVNQSYDRAKQYIDEKLLGKIMDGKVQIGEAITFATVQTLSRLDLNRMKNEWDVIVVDECHRCAASAESTTMFAKVLNGLAARHKFGLSATVHRADGLIETTFALLGNVIYTIHEEETVDRICKVEIQPVQTGVKLTNAALNYDGTLNFTKLVTMLVGDKNRNQKIIEQLVANKEKPTLILTHRVNHISLLMKMLPEELKAKAISVTSQSKGRKELLDDMRAGKYQYLFSTYQLAKEGLDIPRLENLFMTTPQKDYAIVTQSVGRVARVSEGKTVGTVFDFVDADRYLVNTYKQRCTSYRKLHCEFKEAI